MNSLEIILRVSPIKSTYINESVVLMGRGFKTDKELDLVDRLKRENKRLKNDIKYLRKMLDRYEVAYEKGLVSEDGIIIRSKKRQRESDLKKRWKCYKCENGHLELIFLGSRYYRQCNRCDNHTRSQPWNSKVEGLIPNKEEKKQRS